MPTCDPSVKIVHALPDRATRQDLSLPLAIIITGALAEIDATIELTNRVCDSVLPRAVKDLAKPAAHSTPPLA